MGAEGTLHFCKMLHDNCTLRKIDVSGENFVVGSRIVIVVTYVKLLIFSGNSFTDEDAAHWAEALEENKYCKELNLSRNYFGDAGAELLGPAIGLYLICEQATRLVTSLALVSSFERHS